MIDDPLALAVQMIAVLAAGMYPIGFLFGTCSDCCCPACSRCSHHAEARALEDTDFATATTLQNLSITLTVSDGEIEQTHTATLAQSNESIGHAFPFTFIDNGNEYTVDVRFLIQEVFLTGKYNSCGCAIESTISLELEAEFFIDDAFMDVANGNDPEKMLQFVVGETCDQSAASLIADLEWTSVDSAFSPEIEEAFVSFLQSLTFSGSVSFDPCECGACCEEGGQGVICSDNVAEGACPGDWQGVDTLCEDVTCGGTCCDAATGNCTYTTEVGCAGTWTAGGECEPNPCPQPPEGACCDAATGDCSQTIEVNCPGEWSEGVECDPNPCPQPPTGACCQDGNCTETTQADCAGAWLEGVDCDPNPCTLGACCDPFGGCAENVRQDECNAYSQWISGQTCEESDCPPAGTCCEYIDGVFDLSNNFTEYACDQTQALLGIDTVWQPGEDGECPPTNP
jgi:hypothetical protein